MTFRLPRSAARVVERMAWLVLAGMIASACGDDDAGTGGQGGATSSSTSSASGGGGGGGTGGGDGAHLARWVRTFLGGEQRASSVATDPQGNIYVGGTFTKGAVDFGDAQRDCPAQPGGPSVCGFLLKLAPTGETLWSRAFTANRTLSIDVKALGANEEGVVMAASWERYQLVHAPLDLGTGPLDPPGDYPMVLAKFDPEGTAVWSEAFGDLGGEVMPSSVVVDGPESFIVGGGFSTESLDLGAGPMPFISQHTLFLAHFNGTAADWQQSFGGSGEMSSQELAGFGRSPDGHLRLAGSFVQSLDFGGTSLESTASASIFQATLSSSGEFVADQGFDADGTLLNVTSVAADATGSTLFTGLFDGTLELGATSLVCEGNFNGYLAKVDATGAVSFTQVSTEPAASIDGSFCVAADASNNVLWGADLLFIVDGKDTFQGRISKLDPSGATLWTVADKNFGARAFAFDADANVIAVGEFSNEINFAESGPIEATVGPNAFIAKFPP